MFSTFILTKNHKIQKENLQKTNILLNFISTSFAKTFMIQKGQATDFILIRNNNNNNNKKKTNSKYNMKWQSKY